MVRPVALRIALLHGQEQQAQYSKSVRLDGAVCPEVMTLFLQGDCIRGKALHRHFARLGCRLGTRLSNSIRNVFEVGVFILAFGRPDAVKTVSAPPRDDMEVQMEHRLLGRLARRGDQIHTLGIQRHLDRAAYLDDSSHQLGIERRLYLPQVSHVDTRND